MLNKETRARAEQKAVAKIIGITRKLKRLDGELDSPPFGISKEQVQIQINSTLADLEVWEMYLDLVELQDDINRQLLNELT